MQEQNTEKTKNVILRLDPEMHRELKILMAKTGLTFKKYFTDLAIKDLEERKGNEEK